MIEISQTLRAEENAALQLRSIYEAFGYKKFKVSHFEEYNFYMQYKSFLQSEKILSFTDLDGRLLALKPDVTLSIIKNASEKAAQVQKVYYIENVYRESKHSNTFREINQMGLECIGIITDYAVCETVLLAKQSLEAISDSHILELGHIGFVTGLLEAYNINISQRKAILSFLSAKSLHELTSFVIEEGLSDDLLEKLTVLCTLNGDFKATMQCAKEIALNLKMQNALDELTCVFKALNKDNAVKLDFTLLNDTRYYDGIIMAGYIEGVSSPVLAGGRYDGIMHRLNKSLGAIGFAVYLSQLERLFNQYTKIVTDIVIFTDNSAPAELLHLVNSFIQQGNTVIVQQGSISDIGAKQTYIFEKGVLTKC